MATIIQEHVDTSLDGLRISWGGIWAGVLTVLGTLLFLTTLGLAVGISAADPGNTDAGALGVLEVGGRLDDRAGALLGIARLEDPRAHEHAVGASG